MILKSAPAFPGCIATAGSANSFDAAESSGSLERVDASDLVGNSNSADISKGVKIAGVSVGVIFSAGLVVPVSMPIPLLE
jgi:hypothetical protein